MFVSMCMSERCLVDAVLSRNVNLSSSIHTSAICTYKVPVASVMSLSAKNVASRRRVDGRSSLSRASEAHKMSFVCLPLLVCLLFETIFSRLAPPPVSILCLVST